MPNPLVLFYGLIAFNYLLILFVTITGLLKLVMKDNSSIRIIHKWAVPPAVFFWIMVIYASNLAMWQQPFKRDVLFTLFLVLVFGGAMTGWLVRPGARRVLHMVLGALTFVSHTFYVFFILLS